MAEAFVKTFSATVAGAWIVLMNLIVPKRSGLAARAQLGDKVVPARRHWFTSTSL